jgi:hypothetical protein
MQDGSIIAASDSRGSHLLWELTYRELNEADIQALQAHFASCCGPLYGFTFIDPSDNMLASSEDFTTSAWQLSPSLELEAGVPDALGGNGATIITNNSPTVQLLAQSLPVPASYQYCFSTYAKSIGLQSISLSIAGTNATVNRTVAIGPQWSRFVLPAKLNDPGEAVAVAVSIAPGQQVQLYGMQLEAQVVPSRYRSTNKTGGVYTEAHWGVDQLAVVAEGPQLFATSFTVETTL